MMPALSDSHLGRALCLPLALILALPAGVGAQDPAPAAAVGHPEQEPQPRHTREEPLWEVGIGGFAAHAPDYPAAEEGRPIGLGIPFGIYRGELFRVGEDSVASVVPVDEPAYELDVSFDAAFSSDSDNNDAREGMPDLDFLLEAGPQLTIRLLELDFGASGWGQVKLPLQARAVFSTDFTSMEHEGFVLQPGIAYEHENLLGSGFNADLEVAPIWASRGLHEFFYEVDPRFARPDRPAFEAEAGYLGTEISLAGEYPISSRISLFLGTQIGIYDGAANSDSPLFRRDVTISGGMGFTWSFFQSERRVLR
mgnify:CR=1 FL=1